MPDRRQAVREAHQIYKSRDQLDARRRDEKIAILVGHEVWSNRNIVAITGASPWHVQKVAKKSDKRGGKFNPETLPTIERIIRNRDKSIIDNSLYVKAVKEGTSVYVLARLLGESPTNIKRWAGLIPERS